MNGTAPLTMRECLVPRPEFLLCSVDYDGMELRSWSQVCIWAVRQSRMAEVLNAGKDPHTELGARLAGISAAQAYALTGPELKSFKSDWRQPAKIGNFGLPGGMGPDKFRTQARKQYEVFLTPEQSRKVCYGWREEWPEAPLYFEWINSLLGRSRDARGTITHFRSNRVRGDVRYTQACNSFFQGLAADAWKAAGWQLAREMYIEKSSPLFGSRLVNPVHDEYIAEVPETRASEAGMRMAEVMVEVAQEWMPDVKVTASPALMRRWAKDAEPKYNSRGNLIPWEDAA